MQPSCNRSSPSCLQTRASSSSTASNLLHPHQQHPSFYGPLTLQPFTAVLHPSCVYPTQRNTGSSSSALLTPQGNQVNEWQAKSKPQGLNLRNQRHLIYSTKASFPFEPPQINPPLPTNPSPYLLTASNFCHGPYSTDHYNSGVAVISQPFFKPPEVQALCLVQDRQFISQQQTQQYNPYYNLSSTLQTVTANTNLQLPSQMTSYSPFTNNQLSLQTNQIFSNPPPNQNFNSLKDNRLSVSTLELPAIKYPKGRVNSPKVVVTCREPEEEGETENNPSSDYKNFCADVQNNQANSSSKAQEERLSDESSGSFDFTVEAEKMVSALCNTSSNDLEKFESSKNESLFSGAGDNVSNKENWIPDFSVDSVVIDVTSGITVGTQTQNNDTEKYPELIRKTALWGCSEAEVVLNSGKSHRTSKMEWLMNLSSATKTAIIKSSTCFPTFPGDRVFIQDLINSLLRISNGWLILDNYLNKQHSPCLGEKHDRDLINSFHIWEESTHELLQNVIKTFLHLETKSGQEERIETSGTPGTFPGDVSIYTTNDLFEPPVKFNLAPGSAVSSPSQNFQYFFDNKKEAKLKGKWTIAESVSPENSKNFSHFNNESSLNKLDEINANRFRNKGTNSAGKGSSLNAEFFHLRNQILENSNQGQWNLKDNKQENLIKEPIFRFKENVEKQNIRSPQLTLSNSIFSSPGKLDPLHVNADNSCLTSKWNNGKKKNFDPNSINTFENRSEFGPVPMNKITLLSQIEPTSSTANKEGMADNLSAWFASMRNINVSSVSNPETKITNFPRIPSQENTRDKMDLTRQLQLNTNHQLLSLQNMQSIQSAPWNAANLMNDRKVHHDEYDSSEDVRIYMKPGSYNVPKKRHQRKCNRKSDNASSRSKFRHSNKNLSNSFPTSKSEITTTNLGAKINFSVNNESSIFFKNVSDPVQRNEGPTEDVTWKAACASAEVLLETLNFNETFNSQLDQQRKRKDQSLNGKVTEQHNEVGDRKVVFDDDKYTLMDNNQLGTYKDQLFSDEYPIVVNKKQKNSDEMFVSKDMILKDRDLIFEEKTLMFEDKDLMFKDNDMLIKDKDLLIKDNNFMFKNRMFKDNVQTGKNQYQVTEPNQEIKDLLNKNQIKSTNLDQVTHDQLIKHEDSMTKYQDRVILKRDQGINTQDQVINNLTMGKQNSMNMHWDQMITKSNQMIGKQYQMIKKQDQILQQPDHHKKDRTTNKYAINKQMFKNRDQMARGPIDQDQLITQLLMRNETLSDQEQMIKDQAVGGQDKKFSKPKYWNQVLHYQGHRLVNQVIRDQRIINQDAKNRDTLKNQIRINNQMFRNQDQMENDFSKRQDQMMEKKYRTQNSVENEMFKTLDQQIIENENQLVESENHLSRNESEKQRRTKSRNQRDDEDGDASSYEASEDDSESSSKRSCDLSRSNDGKIGKANVKTDSWLIRTLNKASKEKGQNEDNELGSSDSLNSSIHEDEANDEKVVSTLSTDTKLSNINSKDFFPNFSKPDEIFGEIAGKATYSETVRRSASNLGKKEEFKKTKMDDNESIVNGTNLSSIGKKIHKKDVEKSYFLHKSRKAAGKKFFKGLEIEAQGGEKFRSKLSGEGTSIGIRSVLGKGFGKRKESSLTLDGKHKSSDKGWSVWYSSRKKQVLSPLALSKLESIHQTVWNMDESRVFKYPSSNGPDDHPNKMIDDYCKIIKNPMFLETIGYKLKNQVYLKVEHAVRDFRKIVCNSRLYHKNDGEFSSKIDILSKKLEELFEEHFSNLDFENASSAGDTSPVCQRFKLQSQRNRGNAIKKSITGADKSENANEHFN